MTRLLRLLASALLLTSFLSIPPLAAAAPAAQVDVKGGHDDPLIQRFAGSWLIGYKKSDWEQTQFPTGPAVKDGMWVAPVTIEGRLTRLFYLSPLGKSPLEVFRNYQQALVAAGFTQRFACERDCDGLYFAMRKSIDPASGVQWAEGSLQSVRGGSYSLVGGVIEAAQGRLWYGTLPRDGQAVHVLLYTSVAENDDTNVAATFIQIVEPKAMLTGQVQVDAKALDRGLKADGRIAIYGLYFDTGKSEIKPESKEQLGEMAKLMKSDPALKVYIVGHTDNQGSLDANLALSQQRAQAVVAALTRDYQIDGKRMVARGVANLAPLAANSSDAGRAKNRRVELVVQ